MTNLEERNEEIVRHEGTENRHVEKNQSINLSEKERSISAADQNSAASRVVYIVYFIFGALLLLLGFRFILQALGVNAQNAFASLIYGLSAPFVALFATLVNNPSLGGNAVFEITTLVAMAVWAIVAWLIARAVWLVMSRRR